MNSKLREEERWQLLKQIQEWNLNRLDLFALSEPNEKLEFFGVMRFFYQDEGEKISTKCIRVSSTATTNDVIETLVEKFRPDMRMLTKAGYSLLEVHVNGEERKLKDNEKPLIVQLNWGKDDREGRFLLRKEAEKHSLGRLSSSTSELSMAGKDGQGSFKRKLSKREKKELKKKEKEEKMKGLASRGSDVPSEGTEGGVAEKLYSELPESSFTRSISNPELVMRKRRQLKLEKKLQEMNNPNGLQGGILKIYGQSIKPDVPYKTLLLSITDTVAHVVAETLEKYGYEREDPDKFCLVQVLIPPDGLENSKDRRERIMEDDECPLNIFLQHPPSKGSIKFHLRLRPPDAPKKRRLQKNVGDQRISRAMEGGNFSEDTWSNDSYQQLSFFLVPLAVDGRELNVERITVPLGMLEIGKEKLHPPNVPHVFLSAPEILPQHCTLNRSAGGATWIAPANHESAVVFIQGQRVYRPTQIFAGQVIQIGKSYFFRFVEEFPKQNNKASSLQHYSQTQHPYANGSGSSINKRPTYGSSQYSTNAPLPNHPPHTRSPSSSSSSTTRAKDFETTFDLDGQVLTMQGQGHYPSPKMNNKNSFNNINIHSVGRRGLDSDINLSVNSSKTSLQPAEDLLPASFTYPDGYEDLLLKECTSDVNFATIQFKMSPAFLLYMAARSKLPSTMTTPNMLAAGQKIANMSMKVAHLVDRSVKEHTTNPPLLAFWLANSSELTNFFRFDDPLSHLTNQSQVALMEVVQVAFSSFVECLKGELEQTLPSFINPGPNGDDLAAVEDFVMKRQPPKLGNVTHVLSLAMSVLRKCRVNATITILIFSQLFRFINSWIFNCIILEKRLRLCTSEWGRKIRMRVEQVMQWAEKQGLELAAECHMTKILQLCMILECRKPDHLLQVAKTCHLINSLQMQAALTSYIPLPNEPPLSNELVERAIRVAVGGGDLDGGEPQLPEPLDVYVTLDFPDEGFSCDSVIGIPPGLVDFVDGFVRSGHGTFNINSVSSGSWAVYLNRNLPIEDNLDKVQEVINITVNKIQNSLGLSILAAQSERQKESGIFVKCVLPGGAADLDGRIQAGDQLVEVGGKSLVGVTQEKAAEMMSQAGQVVDLVVVKGAAFYHGLSDRLELGVPPQGQQVPEMQQQKRQPTKNEVRGRYTDHLHPNGNASNVSPNGINYNFNVNDERGPLSWKTKSRSSPMIIDPYSNRQPHLINSTSPLDIPSNPQNRPTASSYVGGEMRSSYSNPNVINGEEPYLEPVQVSRFQQRTDISTANAGIPGSENKSIKQQYSRIPNQPGISGSYVDQQLKNISQPQISDLYSTRKEVLYDQGPSGGSSAYAENFNQFPPGRDSNLYSLSHERQGSTAYLGTANLPSGSSQFNDVTALKTSDRLPPNKILRPSSAASNRGPGYAAQMLFPKAQQPSGSMMTPLDVRNSPVVFSQSSLINQNNSYLQNRPYSPAVPDQQKTSNTDLLIQTANQSSEIYQGKSQILLKAQMSPSDLDFPPPPPDTQLAQLKILGTPQDIKQPRLYETGQPRPFDSIQNQIDSQYSSVSLKKPPPIAAKPKITPVDLKSVSLSKSPWEKEAREKEEEEMLKKKRRDEMRRLECKPYLSQEEQLKLKKLQTEEEFDQRLQQAKEEDLDYDTLPKLPNLPKFAVATNGSNYASEPPQFGSYSTNTRTNQMQPDQLISGTLDYPAYKGRNEEKPSPPLPQPSIATGPMRVPGSSALKQQHINGDSSSQFSYASSIGAGPTKKTVTFNEQVGVNEYPAHRSYGSTSSDGSLVQPFDQSSVGSDEQHSGFQEINGVQPTYLPKFTDRDRLVFEQPQISYEVKPRFTPEPLQQHQLKTTEQHSSYPYKPTYPRVSESSFLPSQQEQEQSSLSYPYRPSIGTVHPSEPVLGRNHMDSRNPLYGQRGRTTGENRQENLYTSRGKTSYGNVN